MAGPLARLRVRGLHLGRWQCCCLRAACTGCKAVCHLAGHKGSIFLFRAVWLQTIEAAFRLLKLFCHCVAFPLPSAASGCGCRQGRHAPAHLKPAELLGWFGGYPLAAHAAAGLAGRGWQLRVGSVQGACARSLLWGAMSRCLEQRSAPVGAADAPAGFAPCALLGLMDAPCLLACLLACCWACYIACTLTHCTCRHSRTSHSLGGVTECCRGPLYVAVCALRGWQQNVLTCFGLVSLLPAADSPWEACIYIYLCSWRKLSAVWCAPGCASLVQCSSAFVAVR